MYISFDVALFLPSPSSLASHLPPRLCVTIKVASLPLHFTLFSFYANRVEFTTSDQVGGTEAFTHARMLMNLPTSTLLSSSCLILRPQPLPPIKSLNLRLSQIKVREHRRLQRHQSAHQSYKCRGKGGKAEHTFTAKNFLSFSNVDFSKSMSIELLHSEQNRWGLVLRPIKYAFIFSSQPGSKITSCRRG